MTATDPIVQAVAEALWHHDNAGSPKEWRDMAWADMGDGYSVERIGYELRAEAAVAAVQAAGV